MNNRGLELIVRKHYGASVVLSHTQTLLKRYSRREVACQKSFNLDTKSRNLRFGYSIAESEMMIGTHANGTIYSVFLMRGVSPAQCHSKKVTVCE